MLIGSRTAAWGGGGCWKNPYVTDGLVAMWDADYSLFEEDVIKSAVNNYDMTVVSGSVSIDDNTIHFTEGTYARCISDDFLSIFLSKNYTFEMCVKYAAEKFLISVLNRDELMASLSNNPSILAFGINEIAFSVTNTETYYDGEVASCSFGRNNNLIFIQNKGKKQTKTSSSGTTNTREIDLNTSLARESQSWAQGWYRRENDYFCIRMYNRVLTDEEMSFNQSIDLNRFGAC